MQNKSINKSDILNRDEYKLQRKNLREKMVLRKKNRITVEQFKYGWTGYPALPVIQPFPVLPDKEGRIFP